MHSYFQEDLQWPKITAENIQSFTLWTNIMGFISGYNSNMRNLELLNWEWPAAVSLLPKPMAYCPPPAAPNAVDISGDHKRVELSHGPIIITLCFFSVPDVLDALPAKRFVIVCMCTRVFEGGWNSNCILLKYYDFFPFQAVAMCSTSLMSCAAGFDWHLQGCPPGAASEIFWHSVSN